MNVAYVHAGDRSKNWRKVRPVIPELNPHATPAVDRGAPLARKNPMRELKACDRLRVMKQAQFGPAQFDPLWRFHDVALA